MVLLEAVRAGRGLEEIITTDIPTVALDTPLTDIISVIAGSPYPVAVVDDENRLQGLVFRGAILGALARKEEMLMELPRTARGRGRRGTRRLDRGVLRLAA